MATMASEQVLTLDAALALLQDYEDDLLLEQTLSDADVSSESLSSSSDSEKRSSSSESATDEDECRFKRSRRRRKEELMDSRSQVAGLEERLRVLQMRRLKRTQQLMDAKTEDSSVWRAVAKRMKRERREAEVINAQLKTMVDTTLRYSLWVQSLMLQPAAVNPLLLPKQRQQYAGDNSVVDVVVLQQLLMRLTHLQLTTSTTGVLFDAPSTSSDIKAYRTHGCGLVLEATNYHVLPCDLATATSHVWQHVAFEDSPTAGHTIILEDVVARMHMLHVRSGDLSTTYANRQVSRKVELADQVFIFAAALSEGTPWTRGEQSTTVRPDVHETFIQEELISIKRVRVGGSDVSVVRSSLRLHREACADTICTAGGIKSPTIFDLVEQLPGCIENEVRIRTQAVETRLRAQDMQKTMVTTIPQISVS
ncbi:hypothetical protein Poli38472_007254 [Pythium oligandrum]|uniref:Uncharacterized protein n=1 Tax=Pythium oligandrum TaxID=41045 RepID=A0A8K1C9C8_PYTOL|nr:hypothetical protein Poli38472_007254 [Pythium oligandrum]|eukprot:TMW59109.1 hypothetical protein Poli38472_007254 [Pythium oligandrum]